MRHYITGNALNEFNVNIIMLAKNSITDINALADALNTNSTITKLDLRITK